MKRSLAMMLSMGMCVSMLAGCGSGENSDNKNGDTGNTSTDSVSEVNSSGGTDEGSASGSSVSDFSDEEPYTIKIMMFGDADTEQCKAVSEAISEITREKINAEVEITRIGFGTYATQLNLALSAQEDLDLFNAMTSNVVTLANSGQIMPLTELLNTCGQETLAAIPEADWKAMSVGDEIYALPTNCDKGYQLGFNMRKDIVDELGISIEDIKDFDDLHDMLVKVKAAYPDMYPVVPDGQSMWNYQYYDTLGEQYGASFGVLDLSVDPQSTTVVNLYETDMYREWAERIYQWAQEGLVMPDASSNTESRTSLIHSGKAFGGFTQVKPGFDEEQSISTGYEMVTWTYSDTITTTTTSGTPWCLSNSSQDPERAMAFLNLMYTDPEISNLVINGIEGIHYEFKDKAQGIIGYPEGVGSTNVGYSRLAWGWPNEQISYVWETDKPTVWEELGAFNAGMNLSPAKGFTFDNAAVLNQVTACTNVTQQYDAAIKGGSLDPATAIDEFNAALKAAGIDDIIAEKQKQLDEWLAAQK